jgi:cytochrome c oxidase subunit IV
MTAKAHETKRPYLQVFVALAVLTAVEVGLASLSIDKTVRVLILLGLSAAKAALVALFYMHLRYDHRILALIGGFPLFLVVIMLVIFLADRSLGT